MTLRNRIRSESDTLALRKLRKNEIQVLMDLGNVNAATDCCEKLISEHPGWAPGYSILADICCRRNRWMKAEELFEKAAALHAVSGDADSATRLRIGVVYRLSEARKDYGKCLKLADTGTELGRVLLARTRRSQGEQPELLPIFTGELPRRIAILERAWAGDDAVALHETAIEWEGTEPEWRWRFIVESIDIWRDRGLNISSFREAVRRTVRPVLDPRFSDEWRRLDDF